MQFIYDMKTKMSMNIDFLRDLTCVSFLPVLRNFNFLCVIHHPQFIFPSEKRQSTQLKTSNTTHFATHNDKGKRYSGYMHLDANNFDLLKFKAKLFL